MNRSILLCITSIILLLTTTQLFGQSSNDDYKIVGYVAGWHDWSTDMIDAQKLTHINYAFADIQDGKVSSYLENDDYNYQMLDSLKAENPDLKILVSVGGWSRSTYFSDAALTEESRELFAESAVEYMKKFNLDGVDLDWEYPGLSGAGNVYRSVDKQNFTLMLKVLREHLDRQTELDRREENPYLLTIATGASKNYLEHTEMHKAHQYLDFINIMTYDFHTGGSPIAGHHSNLYPSQSIHFTGPSADQSVQWHIDAGIPSGKLVLGVPFYGRAWSDVRTENNGLYQWTGGDERGSAGFDRLRDEMINKNGFTRYWDDEAQAPYLWNPETKTIYVYDDEQSLRIKTDYIKARGLGGAMFWEYSSNLGEELLNTLYNGLNN
ncbi:glycoside hydrolase family 18 protein [Rhodohalobacter sulfatireducens]|uniref:chitinase n=1 Tax=Rhodohalobacter sulfatireducens TaxID=2911366 RepID=A0ABS9KHH1_9BACT|nr:glycoside hydrolase family 18 protein [Rhodohalobacter sulfatireducens]MCG2590265.1 glycoside hydrolase family 18 protein [Rhodohalobacter sulfatireducens]MDR9367190.1 glycoside hydrolase family 18 protein [Balneolaceae bacterium]